MLAGSKWKFSTSGSAGFSLDVVAVSGGVIDFIDPDEKTESFHFGGIGAGFGTPGIKIPKFGSFLSRIISGRFLNSSGSTTEQMNKGVLFKTGLIGERELTRSDIVGACVIAELGISLPVQGRTATVILMGMDPHYYYRSLLGPASEAEIFLTGHGSAIMPKAITWIWGDTRGLVAGGTAYVGILG